MEVRRGDLVDTIWFKHAMVQRTMGDYVFIIFKPIAIRGTVFQDMWISKCTITCLYRNCEPYTEL